MPPYSADLNHLEEGFSKIKRLLRVVGARTKEALMEAIDKTLDMVSVQGAKDFFSHCGYRGMEQQLRKTL